METQSPAQNKQKSRQIIPLVFASFVIVSLVAVSILLSQLNKNKKAALLSKTSNSLLSGSIDLNGNFPPGSTIDIEARKFSGGNFQTVAGNLSAADGAAWSWNQAAAGTAYVVKALLKSNGSVLAQSDILIAVAPAAGENLSINAVSANEEAKRTTISGQIDLNGYLPPSSSISIVTRKSGEQKFSTVAAKINAVDGQVWSWSDALAGTNYEIQALLIGANGAVISQSQVIAVTAPAHNENLRINSSAKSPQSNLVSVSGKISFNGPIPAGSSISIAQRQSGQNQFTMFVSGLPVADGITWNFNQAIPGVTYDFQAYLVTNGNTAAQSGIVAVAAPAVNEILSLNMIAPPPAPPSSSLSFDCLGTNTVNNVQMWQARISYNNNSVVKNAQQFHLIIGNSGGGNQISDVTANPKDPNHPEQGQSYTTGYVLTQNQTYYVQYAYSACCGVFSSYSPAMQFTCNPFPTNTPVPLPTNTPVPQPTNTPVPPTSAPLPTNTPIPTDTPKISQCNQSCGGNGYSCAEGLSCLQEGGEIGGTVCRNAVCPDQTDCTCP